MRTTHIFYISLVYFEFEVVSVRPMGFNGNQVGLTSGLRMPRALRSWTLSELPTESYRFAELDTRLESFRARKQVEGLWGWLWRNIT